MNGVKNYMYYKHNEIIYKRRSSTQFIFIILMPATEQV